VWRIRHALADGATTQSVRPEDDHADRRRRLGHLSAFVGEFGAPGQFRSDGPGGKGEEDRAEEGGLTD
jgi:hypothetical protein